MTPAESVEQNLVEFFRHFARVRPTGRVAELDGVSIASSGIQFHMFNAAFFSSPVSAAEEDLGRRLSLAADFLERDGARWAFWTCVDKLRGDFQAHAGKAFRRRDLYAAFKHPGMVCEELRTPQKPPAILDCRRVQDRSERIEFARLNSLAFRIPFVWCMELYDIEALWEAPFTGYLGYADGQFVCCAATLVAAEAVGVYSVATQPGQERRGYGEAITRHAVNCAREESGLTRSILQATNAGLPLYRRMGYELVTHFVVYSR